MLMLSHPEWHLRAACRGRRDVSWFPTAGRTAAPAVAVCRTCPVREECLAWALSQPLNPVGIWGGHTEDQRRRMRLNV
jgi:WhiB family redox-sensing transcriptional regulator